jgi:pimeloyl-ACP methyl ester carboxylesterase
MTGPMGRLAVAAALAATAVSGCQADGSAGASPAPGSVTLANGSLALAWGDGAYGLVLVHGAAYDAASWEPQARVFADNGMRVLAVEDASADGVEAAIRHLHDAGVDRVALLGASAGAAPVLQLGREEPDLVDQLIVLSGSGDVTALGDFPKLFAASEGEGLAADAERMAEEAPGAWNALYVAGGDAHAQAIFETDGGPGLLEAIVLRLEERR